MLWRSPKPVRIQVSAKTDLGKTRDHNEDRFLVADLTRGEASLQQPVREHDVGERGTLLIVADGMGGAAAGELASQMAADTIYDQMVRMWRSEKEATPQRFAPERMVADYLDAYRAAVARASLAAQGPVQKLIQGA